MIQAILNGLADMLKFFFYYLWEFILILWNSIYGAIEYILIQFGIKMEFDFYRVLWDPFMPYLQGINEYLPLYEGYVLFISYMGYYITLTFIKWVLKAIPTIWG